MKNAGLISSLMFFLSMTATANEAKEIQTYSTEQGDISVAVAEVEQLTIMTIVNSPLKGRTRIAKGQCERIWYHDKGEALYCETPLRQFELKLH